MTPLHNRTALVTGGGRGIGRGIALALAKLGADVALVARTQSEIEAVAEELRAIGSRAIALPADVTNYAQVQQVVQATSEQLGPVDILINNAGVIGPLGALENTDPEAWAFTQMVNVVGPYHTVRETLPGMKEKGYGRIINISSGASRPPGKIRAGSYSASKAAVNLFAQNTGAEIEGTGVTINAVFPGVVDTDMTAHIRAQDTTKQIPLKARLDRMAASDELGNAERVGWLVCGIVLSDKNGEVLDVRLIPDELDAILAAHNAPTP